LVTFFESQEKICILGNIPAEAKELALQVRKVGPDPVRAEILLEGIKKFTSTLYSLYFSTLQQLQPDQKL
jgi:hypothetical protein